MAKRDLKDNIISCTAFDSLAKEQVLAKSYHKLNWTVFHGAFYQDLESKKYREIDIVARQVWSKGLKLVNNPVVRINMLVESKSASGYHLIFSPLLTPLDRLTSQRIWIGYEEEFNANLLNILNEKGFKLEQISNLKQTVKMLSFPDNIALLSHLMIDPPISHYVASTFRETNIGSVKELNNSVLWRAGQVLNSAFKSFKKNTLDYHTSWITSGFEDPTLSGDNIEKDILGWYNSHCHMLDIYHPVAVIDSMLWFTDGVKINEVDWCRFVQLSENGQVTFWFDVVNHSYFKKYLKEITDYYKTSFREHRLKLIK